MLHKRYVHTIVLSNDLQLCIWHPLQWLRPDDGFVFTNSVLHTYLISEYVECGGTGEYTEEVGSDTKRENRQEKKEQTVREEMKTQNTLKKNRKLDAKSFEKQRRRWRLQAASISNACCHNWILLCIFFFASAVAVLFWQSIRSPSSSSGSPGSALFLPFLLSLCLSVFLCLLNECSRFFFI